MILAAGLTPAWQQILEFDRFEPGGVNRARTANWCASGKVLNVARACRTLGAESLALTTVGGRSGAALREAFDQEGASARWINALSPTRTCTTLLDTATGLVTELVENAGPASDAEREAFLDEVERVSPFVTMAVLTGSLPAGTPSDFYARVIQRLRAPVVLDVRGPELLAALPLRPLLVKPNRDELSHTLGRALDSRRDVLRAMRELLDRGAQSVLVTSGAAEILLARQGEPHLGVRWEPFPVDRLINSIGCGDCVAAGIAVRMAEGAPLPEAVAFGLAAAAENACDLFPARPAREAVERRLAGFHSQPEPITVSD